MVLDREWLDAASGRRPVDLLLRRARWLDVFSGTFRQGDIGVYRGRFTGPGSYRARRVLDLEGRFLVPGLIDAHCHLESTMLTPREFARAVLPRGTTAVVADPHEIANVLGLEGIRYLVEATQGVPFRFRFTLPSCVPATHLETAGAKLSAQDLALLSKEPWVAGLGEAMNVPGVVLGDPEVHEKLGLFRGRVVDGHSPGWTGRLLNAYVGSGIRSDHECTSLEEAREKLSLGMWIMIRQGSTARNLEALLPLVNERSVGRCLLVTDDRTPEGLFREGHLDSVLDRAIELGLDPILAFRMVTLNPALYFGFPDMGAIAPGYLADALVLESLGPIVVSRVLLGGKLVWSRKTGLRGFGRGPLPATSGSFSMAPIFMEQIRVEARGDRIRLIELVQGQILTKQRWVRPRIRDGQVVSDTTRDILKILVAERHRGTGNVGVGFVRGFGLKRGALASSVAHDSHNIVAVGVEDRDLIAAVREVPRMGGGLVAVESGRVLASLPLPVAGIISSWPLERVVKRHAQLLNAARKLGSQIEDPFMILSFLALPVIPELKITDLGLVNVKEFRTVDLFKGQQGR